MRGKREKKGRGGKSTGEERGGNKWIRRKKKRGGGRVGGKAWGRRNGIEEERTRERRK